MGDSDIIAYLKGMENESKNLKLELMKLCWHMRGGMSWNEALVLSPGEREIVSQLVKENMDTTKKSGHPFF
jgi:hypothetical protein